MNKFNFGKGLGFFTVMVFAFTPLNAAFEMKETGARAAALSGAYTALSQDALAPFWNPAGVRAASNAQVTSFYIQLFAMNELSNMGLSSVIPSRWGGLGFALAQFGSKGYREQELNFSHGVKVWDTLLVGYRLRGLILSIDQFGLKAGFSLDSGFLFHFYERLDAGFVLRNINQPSFGKTEEKIPMAWTGGAAYRPLQGVTVSVDVVREGAKQAVFKSGMELALSPALVLRGGIQNSPPRFSGGLGFKRGNVSLDYAYLHHFNLPGGHQLNLSYRWGAKENEPDSIVWDSARLKPAGRKKSSFRRFGQNSKINLLKAAFEDLDAVAGIGPITAQMILDYRDQKGLARMEDLLNIPSMTKRTFFILEDCCVVEGEP